MWTIQRICKYEFRHQPQEFNPTSVQSDAKKTEALTNINKLSKQSHFADRENGTQTFQSQIMAIILQSYLLQDTVVADHLCIFTAL